MWKPEFTGTTFPVIPVMSWSPLWVGALGSYPPSLPLRMALLHCHCMGWRLSCLLKMHMNHLNHFHNLMFRLSGSSQFWTGWHVQRIRYDCLCESSLEWFVLVRWLVRECTHQQSRVESNPVQSDSQRCGSESVAYLQWQLWQCVHTSRVESHESCRVKSSIFVSQTLVIRHDGCYLEEEMVVGKLILLVKDHEAIHDT